MTDLRPSIPYDMPWLPPLIKQLEDYATQVARDGKSPLSPRLVPPRGPSRKQRMDAGTFHAGGVPEKLLKLIKKRPGSTAKELREHFDLTQHQYKSYSRALSEMVSKGVIRYEGSTGFRSYWPIK